MINLNIKVNFIKKFKKNKFMVVCELWVFLFDIRVN